MKAIKNVMIILYVVLVLFIIGYLIYIYYDKTENYCGPVPVNDISKITGHFGGIPSIAEIQPYCGGVAMPPGYENPEVLSTIPLLD